MTAAARPVLPYGSWPSALTPEVITRDSVRLFEVQLEGSDTYWVEGRPQEGGRQVLVHRAADGTTTDVVPAELGDGRPFDVRTRAHEYGGASYAACGDVVVVSRREDDRLYRVDRDGGAFAPPAPLTAEDGRRYADLEIDATRGLVLAVAEDHGEPGGQRTDPESTLVAVPLDGSAAQDPTAVSVLARGTDFVSSPRLSPDGAHLAWVTWDHPNMPWDSTTLWVARVEDGAGGPRLAGHRTVAGGAGVSVAEPAWTPEGDLVHVDDRSGWWNLYRTQDVLGESRTRSLHPAEAEFTVPQWGFGPRTYDVLDAEHLVCSWSADGRRHLGTVRLANGELETWAGEWEPAGTVRACEDRVVFIAESATRPGGVVELDVRTHATTLLRSTSALDLPTGEVARAEAVSWDTPDGARAHGFFYAPTSSTAVGPEDERPPLLVMSHGGPTAATSAGFDPRIQFWTTRGLAVLDVNYGGSTGYGRAYRERLNGGWGVVDIDDCAAGALWLSARGLVDTRRLAIRGGSAGGFTTLAALTFRDVFTAGVSLYGIGDLEALARDTHKFESRYLDSLVGEYPAEADLYRQRSPIHHTDGLDAPMVLLQGLEDRVVPPDQARSMADALRAKGRPVALVLFEGEGHGFRRAETIRAALQAELSFYGQVFGFTPAGDLPELMVENLPQR